MTLRTLLVAALALGLSACSDSADTPTVAGDVSTAGTLAEAPDIPAGTYAIDATHSSAEFGVRHLGISTVSGRFNGVDGTVTIGDDITTMEATAVIDASTINTDNEDRDGHLRSPDFFDVAQYPEITFEATEVRVGEGGRLMLVGDLTMRGVTRPVELETEYLGTASMGGTQKIAFTASGEINRTNWGLTWAETNEVGEALVGDIVTLTINVEADRQAGATPEA